MVGACPGRGQGGGVSDIYSVFNFGSHPGAAQAPLLPPLEQQGGPQQQQGQQQQQQPQAPHGALEPFPGLQSWGEQAAAAAAQRQQQAGGQPPPGSPLPQGMAAAMLAASPPGARQAGGTQARAPLGSPACSPRRPRGRAVRARGG